RFFTADGIRLETLDIVPVQEEVVSYGDVGTVSAPLSAGGEGEHRVNFGFSVSTGSGNAAALKELLVRLERSIRPISLTNVVIEAQGSQLVLKGEGYTYYQPERT